MNVVLNLLEPELERLISQFKAAAVPSKSPYVRFAAKLKGLTITAYTSGKVLFQGVAAEKVASDFDAGKVATALQSKANQADKAEKTAPASAIAQADCLGTDEVGNGSYFGSLVVAASFVTADSIEKLRQLGVADSKKLDDAKICELAPVLEDLLPHVILTVSPEKYNQVIEQGYNAVSIKVALHNQAIYLLEKKLPQKPAAVVIDAFTSPGNYQKYVRKEAHQVASKVTLLTKAEDQFLAVAASSIMARSKFLADLRQRSQDWQIELPSGAGHKSDVIASQILAEHGLEALGQLAKLHFANTKKAMQLAENRK